MKKYIISALALFIVSASFVSAFTPVTGTQKVGVVILRSVSSGNYGNIAQMKADIAEDLFTGDQSIAKYYNEASFGKLTISGSISDIYGPYNVPVQKVDCDADSLRTAAAKAVIAVTQSGADLGHYDQLFFLSSLDSCSDPDHLKVLGGMYIGNRWVWVRLNTYDKYGALGNAYSFSSPQKSMAHELGHSLGMGHARGLYCTEPGTDNQITVGTNCNFQEYADPFDIMGSAGSKLYHPSAFFKIALGWLTQDHGQTITESGVYSITPLEQSPGPQLLRIAVSGYSSYKYLYLQYRRPLGFDRDNNDFSFKPQDGVWLGLAGDFDYAPPYNDSVLATSNLADFMLIDTHPYKPGEAGMFPFVDAALKKGEEFTYPFYPVKIKVLDVNSQEAQVQVTLTNDNLTLTAPPPPPAVSATYTITKAEDRFYLPLGAKWNTNGNLTSLTFNVVGPTNQNFNVGPYDLNLSQVAKTYVGIKSVALVHGHYTVTAKAVVGNTAEGGYSRPQTITSQPASFDVLVGNGGVKTLTVTKSGTGSGTITSSVAGINCGATCSHVFERGQLLSLNASAASGSTFVGWSGGGCVSKLPTCYLVVSADKTVTAEFKKTKKTDPLSPPITPPVATDTQLPTFDQPVTNLTNSNGYHVKITVIAHDDTAINSMGGDNDWICTPGYLAVAREKNVTCTLDRALTFLSPGQVITLTATDKAGNTNRMKLTVGQFNVTSPNLSGVDFAVVVGLDSRTSRKITTTVTAWLATPPPAVSQKVTNIVSTTNRTDGINVTWTAPAGATKFAVYRCTTSTGGCVEVSTLNGITAVSFLDTGIAVGAEYYHAIDAYNPNGSGNGWSGLAVSTTKGVRAGTAPPPPAVSAVTNTWQQFDSCSSGNRTSWYTDKGTGKTVNQCVSQSSVSVGGTIVTNAWLQYGTCGSGTKTSWYTEPGANQTMYQCIQTGALTNGGQYLTNVYVNYDDCLAGDTKTSWFMDTGTNHMIYECLTKATYSGATGQVTGSSQLANVWQAILGWFR